MSGAQDGRGYQTRSMGTYARDAVLTATPARLLTMLYDRLLIDLIRAELAQSRENWSVAALNLTHGEEIIAELASTLKVDQWDGAERMFALYTYLLTLITEANIEHDPEKTRTAIQLLEPLRLAWHDAADREIASSAVENSRGLGVA